MRQYIQQSVLTATLALLISSTIAPVLAQDNNPEVNRGEQGRSVTGVLQRAGEQTQLPSFDTGHARQSAQPGISNLSSVIFFVIDFGVYIMGSIAVLFMIISGVKMVLASQNEVDEVLNKEKKTFQYALIGLIMIISADQVIRGVFWGEEGEIYRTGADLQQAAERGSDFILGFVDVMRVALPSVAVLFFVISGVRMIGSAGSPEVLENAKKQMLWSVMGLILAGLVEVIVFRIVFPDQGARLSDPAEFNRLIVTMTNFVSGFIATAAIIMIIYAGYLYTISLGGEGHEKAKKIVFGAIIGLLISMAAFALVNTFIRVEPIAGDVIVENVQVNLPE